MVAPRCTIVLIFYFIVQSKGFVEMLSIVAASRLSLEQFREQSMLYKSLSLLPKGKFKLYLYLENSAGLSSVYNDAVNKMKASSADGPVVFLHDDILLPDYFWIQHLTDGLEVFDVVGVAGNVRRVAGQPGWAFKSANLDWDDKENLSGAVAHGAQWPSRVSWYGPTRQRVKLLDGVFLATKLSIMLDHNLYFDERFTFHFYDMDFCRAVEEAGLSCGTWDVPIVHRSGGAFNSPAWRDAYRQYLDKWEN